jgi:molybdate transport system substrate-binding protein
MRKFVVAVIVASVVTAISGCGSSTTPGTTTTTSAQPTGTITVLAAASLTKSFNDLKTRFEATHPGVTVKINYDGSATLVQQITNGAAADVFASADQANMTKVVSAGLNDSAPQVFARNKLEIAVPPNNPKGIASFADLAKPGVILVVCADPVPCGAATKKIEQATGVTLHPASQETAVTGVLSKVQAGEADAGLVYVTDVNSAGGKVKGIPFAESDKAVNEYPITVLKNAPQAVLAKQFVEFVHGSAGHQVLGKVGFETP